MVVVSGCPRSGTSIMTLCLISALKGKRTLIFGDMVKKNTIKKEVADKILKNLDEKGLPDLKQGENETDQAFQLRNHLYKKNINVEIRKKAIKRRLETDDMNPTGFHENRYTVRGCNWHIGIKPEIFPKSICKIVAQGLPNTNPDYVSKIVYMIRHPYVVATSQERLTRQDLVVEFEGKEIDLSEAGKINSPDMFIQVTKQAARWFLATGFDPFIVQYDDLIENPMGTMEKVIDYIGEGDANLCKDKVKPSLKRSLPNPQDGEAWTDALDLYELFLKKDFKAIVDYELKETNAKKFNFKCSRVNSVMTLGHCKNCISENKEFAARLLIYAEKQKIDWEKEPCLYECGIYKDVVEKPITVEHSITNHSWKKKDILDMVETIKNKKKNGKDKA